MGKGKDPQDQHSRSWRKTKGPGVKTAGRTPLLGMLGTGDVYGCHLPSMIVMGSPGSILKAPGSVTSLTQRPSESQACGDRSKGSWAFVIRKDLPLRQINTHLERPPRAQPLPPRRNPKWGGVAELASTPCQTWDARNYKGESCLWVRGPGEKQPAHFIPQQPTRSAVPHASGAFPLLPRPTASALVGSSGPPPASWPLSAVIPPVLTRS